MYIIMLRGLVALGSGPSIPTLLQWVGPATLPLLAICEPISINASADTGDERYGLTPYQANVGAPSLASHGL